MIALSPKSVGVAAEAPDTGQIVGVGLVQIEDRYLDGALAPVAHLYALTVHPSYRRRGIAAQLAQWRIAYARQKAGEDVAILAFIQKGNAASLAAARKWGRLTDGQYRNSLIRTRQKPPPETAGLIIRLGLAMAYEALFLFPRFTSIQEITGISLYKLGLLLSSLGLFACVLLLAWRTARLPRASYIRQQLTILLVFFIVGVFPAIVLTIIPRALLDTVLLPFPIAITLMIFIPAGYLFVIYRKGMLGLDPFFSRTIYLAILSLIVFAFYAGGLYLALRWLNLDSSAAMAPAATIFFPTLLLTIYANKPVHEFVQRLVYGDGRVCDKTLADITLALSARPELATLEQIVDMLTAALDISQAILLVQNEKGNTFLAASVGVAACTPVMSDPVASAARPVLRSAARSPAGIESAFQNFTWAELLIPIVVRNKQAGLLALSRPGQDGYFNARQLSFLIQTANVLAVGSDNITLFEAALSLSRQALVVREQERKQLVFQVRAYRFSAPKTH